MKNIRDKFIISIIDNNGIRQFNIHRFVKKFLFYCSIFIIIFAFVLFFAIKILASELKSMQNHKDDTIDKYVVVYNDNANLQQEIEQSQHKLNEINQKILDLEDVISLRNSSVEVEPINQFDLKSLNLNQKNLILKLLPNSKPFNSSIEAKNSLLKSGIVFILPPNTPIYATADGIVDLTRSEDTKGIGKFVKLVHSFGFSSIYGHLSKVSVNRGDVVKKGDIIGYSGKNSEADNLYYDIRFLGSEVDLKNFINWDIDSFEIVMNSNSIVNWNSLLWTFNDMMQISNHKVLSQEHIKSQI
ncbi:M23 family metallopeptidase [Helicobacter sp. MIT 14-3879]|uniref:M23 family metallopeptidase n=1 Tax=Helicobacter sp. MIT 14-3879 TaxID=2040649 RepID=UPI000E1F5A13|nr:M23 family metallopeptidase [Helicobacter sp. MIT 14-3879]RDU65433.1 hypothetical protein CQA44_00110 [Helicobacter sp. MIT 14-3879]